MFLEFIVLLLLPADSCLEKLKPALLALQQKNPSEAASILQTNGGECGQTSFYSELLGTANELLGKRDAAVEAYEHAVTLEPKNARFHFELGASLLENGKPQSAVRELKLGLQLDPSNAAGQRYLLGVYISLNDWQSASHIFESLGAFEHPRLLKDPVMILWFARVLVETKRTEQIDKSISLDDPAMTPALLFSLGGLFADHRMYRQVVRFLSRIPAADADDAVYFNLAEAYSHLQEYEKARAAYFQAIDKHPGHIDSYLHIGLDYASLGDQNKAVPWLAQAHTLAPDRADIAYALAEQLVNLGYATTADELLKTALANHPADALLLVASGDLAFLKGQADAAVQLYRDALAKSPGITQALIGLARVQISQLKYDDAKQSLQLALSESPNDKAAEAAMGLLEYKNGLWDSSVTFFEKAWGQNHANAQIGLELSRAYRKAGRLSDAFRLLTSLEPRLRNLPAYHFELSQLCGQLHKADQSKTELEAFNSLQQSQQGPLRFEEARTYVF